MGPRDKQAFFESPHAVTYILILLNAAFFAVSLIGNSLTRIDSATLFQYGALYSNVLPNQEYWRLIAYAFLHADVLHFGLNMLCIAAWSGLLERRLGATYFLLVYIASAVGAGLASLYGHAGPFLSVGASGAISGIVGGLLCLTILGKLALSPQFFIVTIGVNGILAAKVAHIDWVAHLGGFTAGFAMCAVLNNIEGLNPYWLKCKFPEFVKFGIAVAAMLGIASLNLDVISASGRLTAHAIEWGVGILLAIKLADLILARRKGLAIVALATAIFYGFIPIAVGSTVSSALPSYCVRAETLMGGSAVLQEAMPYVDAACQHTALWSSVLGFMVFALALLIFRAELLRGLSDVGFIANTLRAERNRRQGL